MSSLVYDLSPTIRSQFNLDDEEDYKRAMYYYALIIRARAKQRYGKSFICECGKEVSFTNKKKHDLSPYHKKRTS